MKTVLKLFMFFFVLTTFIEEVNAATGCACWPNPLSKKYPENGYIKTRRKLSIRWSCEYTCAVKNDQGTFQDYKVTGTYAKDYRLPENGLEGTCEGMIYEPEFSPDAPGFSIYMYHGNTESFNPHSSKSAELQAFADSQACPRPGLFRH